MSKPFKLAVIIGRFQPFHNGHLALYNEAKKQADAVLFLIGSSNKASNTKNPWSYTQRKNMVLNSAGSSSAYCEPIDDHDSDYNWIAQVQKTVHDASCKIAIGGVGNDEVCVIGHRKVDDESTYYLDCFPQWGKVLVEETIEIAVQPSGEKVPLSSTLIRKTLACTSNIQRSGDLINHIPAPVVDHIWNDWTKTPAYENFVEECKFLEQYPKDWGKGPFVTTDAFVVCCDRVLLVTRRDCPGKGLLAMPGGFLEPDQAIKSNIIKELTEETGINVEDNLLPALLKNVEVFSDVNRSMRGRIVTHCGFIDLRHLDFLPYVAGGDDAAHAEWYYIPDVINNFKDKMFSDHYEMFIKMLSLID